MDIYGKEKINKKLEYIINYSKKHATEEIQEKVLKVAEALKKIENRLAKHIKFYLNDSTLKVVCKREDYPDKWLEAIYDLEKETAEIRNYYTWVTSAFEEEDYNSKKYDFITFDLNWELILRKYHHPPKKLPRRPPIGIKTKEIYDFHIKNNPEFKDLLSKMKENHLATMPKLTPQIVVLYHLEVSFSKNGTDVTITIKPNSKNATVDILDKRLGRWGTIEKATRIYTSMDITNLNDWYSLRAYFGYGLPEGKEQTLEVIGKQPLKIENDPEVALRTVNRLFKL